MELAGYMPDLRGYKSDVPGIEAIFILNADS
jgi:hypothetical protein